MPDVKGRRIHARASLSHLKSESNSRELTLKTLSTSTNRLLLKMAENSKKLTWSDKDVKVVQKLSDLGKLYRPIKYIYWSIKLKVA